MKSECLDIISNPYQSMLELTVTFFKIKYPKLAMFLNLKLYLLVEVSLFRNA